MQAQTRAGASCIANIEVMHAAVASYVQEHGTFPNPATWNIDVAPYMQTYLDMVDEAMDGAPAYLTIDVVEVGGAPTCHFPDELPTGIALNTALAGQSLADLDLNPDTPVLAVYGPAEPNAGFRVEDLTMGEGGSRFDRRRLGILTTLQGKKVIGDDPVDFDMIVEKPDFSLKPNP